MERSRRHLLDSFLCPCCGNCFESIIHALRDCIKARAVWEILVPQDLHASFFSGNVVEWLQACMEDQFQAICNVNWETVFGNRVWFIWKWRNELVFNNSRVPLASRIHLICSAASNFVNASANSLLAKVRPSYGRDTILIQWFPPEPDWVVLNSDDASSRSTAKAAAGGVFRNNVGAWLGGFSFSLPLCHAYRVQLWGMFLGLREAWRMGLRKVQLQVDNVAAALVRFASDGGPNGDLVCRIKDLLSRQWQVQVIHVYREANFVADKLASLGLEQHVRWSWYGTAPVSVLDLFHYDRIDTYYTRLV